MATAIVAALSAGMAGSAMTPLFAADSSTKDTATQRTDKTAEQDFIRVSEDALMTMRNVRSARLAIFNGAPNEAQTYADAAAIRVAATLTDVDKYALDTKETVNSDDEYVPFDASLTVTDSFVPNEANLKHIAKANEHLHKGEKKKAIEVLKLGEVDVVFATRLVPVKLAQQHIDEADKLVGAGKYYEANLALKAVEDAVVVQTLEVDAVPEVKANN